MSSHLASVNDDDFVLEEAKLPQARSLLSAAGRDQCKHSENDVDNSLCTELSHDCLEGTIGPSLDLVDVIFGLRGNQPMHSIYNMPCVPCLAREKLFVSARRFLPRECSIETWLV